MLVRHGGGDRPQRRLLGGIEQSLLGLPALAVKRKVYDFYRDIRAAQECEQLPLINDGVGMRHKAPSFHDEVFASPRRWMGLRTVWLTIVHGLCHPASRTCRCSWGKGEAILPRELDCEIIEIAFQGIGLSPVLPHPLALPGP